MNQYILPVQRILLEYVLKLGDMILFSGNVSNEEIECSTLPEDEKERLRLVIKNNRSFFTKQFPDMPFLLISSQYDINEINRDITIFEKILNDANRKLDYIRILQCPFNKPEYTMGMPGNINGKRVLFAINDDFSIGAYKNEEEEFYLMLKGIGLDVGVRENDDLRLYKAIYSHRSDEVYNLYRRYIAEACEALQITDATRCFVFLFSKIEGMGLDDTYSFTENKKRILSIIAENQSNFDVISSQLYFYSKQLRTEIVHKGKKIEEIVSIKKAQDINQELFNIIIQFCTKIIESEITDINLLKEYIINATNRYTYTTPEKKKVSDLPAVFYQKTTYVASIEGLQINYPQKRGDYLLIPSLNQFEYSRYYKNYVLKDLGEEYDYIFKDFSIEDFEYIIEILCRCDRCDDKYPRVIGLKLPKLSDEEIRSPIIREQFVDYICNKLNEFVYYDMLSGGSILNGEILPPRVGLKIGIRLIYEFVESKEGVYLKGIPGRVFSEYRIPADAYKCIKLYKDDIYEILYNKLNYIDALCKRTLINICETEYIRDWTQRISYLFDIFDGIDPRNHNKQKVIKLVFTMLAVDKKGYLQNKQKYEYTKEKYRNPILHGGKSIFEIETNINEIIKIDLYLRNIIQEYCVKIHALGISTWEELDDAYQEKQNLLKL